MRDLGEEAIAGLLDNYSIYVKRFKQLMDKFKAKEVVTRNEIDDVEKQYNDVLVRFQHEEKTLKQILTSNDISISEYMPDFIWIQKCYEAQNAISSKDVIEDDEVESPNQVVKTDSEDDSGYKNRLARAITDSANNDPIKKLNLISTWYKEYKNENYPESIPQDGAQPEPLDKKIESYLQLEYHRATREAELTREISAFKEKASKRTFIAPVEYNRLRDELKKQCTYIQIKYEYYMLKKQTKDLTDSLQNFAAVEKDILNGRCSFSGYSSNSKRVKVKKVSKEILAQTTKVSHSNGYVPYFGGKKKAKSFDNATEFRSPLYSIYSIKESEDEDGDSVEDQQLAIGRKVSATDLDGVSTVVKLQRTEDKPRLPKRSTKGSSTPDITLNISPLDEVSTVVKLQRTEDKSRLPKRSTKGSSTPDITLNISPSLWLLIGLTGAALVTGVVLLALTTAISTPFGIAGASCVVGSLLSVCAFGMFPPKVEQRKDIKYKNLDTPVSSPLL